MRKRKLLIIGILLIAVVAVFAVLMKYSTETKISTKVVEKIEVEKLYEELINENLRPRKKINEVLEWL